MDEQELKQKLTCWGVDAPANSLTDRIVAHAAAQKQCIPLAQSFTAAFCDWQTALAYKTAGLALCALIGFGNGYLQQETEMTDIDISALAFSDAAFTGEML